MQVSNSPQSVSRTFRFHVGDIGVMIFQNKTSYSGLKRKEAVQIVSILPSNLLGSKAFQQLCVCVRRGGLRASKCEIKIKTAKNLSRDETVLGWDCFQ